MSDAPVLWVAVVQMDDAEPEVFAGRTLRGAEGIARRYLRTCDAVLTDDPVRHVKAGTEYTSRIGDVDSWDMDLGHVAFYRLGQGAVSAGLFTALTADKVVAS